MGLAQDLADMAEDARQQLYETSEQLRVSSVVEQTIFHGNEPSLNNSDDLSSQEHDNQQIQQQNQQQEVER